LIDLIQNQLLAQASFLRAQRVDAASYGGDMGAQVKVEAFNQGRINLPAIGGQHLGDCFQGAKDDAVCDTYQPATSHRLDDLSVKQPWLPHPTRLGDWPS